MRIARRKIYIKIPEGMPEVLKKDYTYKEILTMMESICDLLQAAHFWFKEYIKTMTPKA